MEHSRNQILTELYWNYCVHISDTPSNISRSSQVFQLIDAVVPHPRLRLMLLSDPAMAALLPVSKWRFSLGPISAAPFCLHESEQIVRISPALLDDAAALAVAARWGLELAHAREEIHRNSKLAEIIYHGNSLLAGIGTASRNLFLSLLPERIAAAVWGGGSMHITQDVADWICSLATRSKPTPPTFTPEPLTELAAPLEHILISGGDSRLLIDPSSGCNRYGVPPRPRPDAVHFSSSTASAISDYGFALCELLRRELLRTTTHNQTSDRYLISRMADAIGQDICAILGLQANQADVVITPSGTDAEWIAVLASMAGAEDCPLTNILIAPDETGSGVALAGAGCYFDNVVASGLTVKKGMPIWPNEPISVQQIAIRGPDGAPRPITTVDREFLATGKAALARGERVLAHVLLASKTGLIAPSTAAVNELVALAPDRVDVVADACQMRMSFEELGIALERGWMLQISGSKFLTGPPFSGAVVLPLHFRSRLSAVQRALNKAPSICPGEFWSTWWSERLAASDSMPSYGPLFRWLPALAEARLLDALSEKFRREAFNRFRDTLITHINRSPYLHPISIGAAYDKEEEFARLSIVSFQVMGRTWNGELCPLTEPECRYLFEELNKDVSTLFSDLKANERALAKQKFHIGQPVTLQTCVDRQTVLRLVVGARFFTIVGYAEEGASMAALDSEIADAIRAIAKIEMLASQWWRLAKHVKR